MAVYTNSSTLIVEIRTEFIPTFFTPKPIYVHPKECEFYLQ
jgi:hypothetical protein